MSSGWARARVGDRADGRDGVSRGARGHTVTRMRVAGAVRSGSARGARSRGSKTRKGLGRRIDERSTLAATGERWTDALLHRIRGDILRRLHPDDHKPAEEAYLAAVAVAREQGARSFGLLAALKLAKLYQSTARPVEAHEVLAPALEGSSRRRRCRNRGGAGAARALADTNVATVRM